ncbi:hypothetical protein NECID01_1764 [Nematocida sp. AWRm77]|nr:hypothetical protein NECID01_1764 [Nematocida sp. AWRm77]
MDQKERDIELGELISASNTGKEETTPNPIINVINVGDERSSSKKKPAKHTKYPWCLVVLFYIGMIIISASIGFNLYLIIYQGITMFPDIWELIANIYGWCFFILLPGWYCIVCIYNFLLKLCVYSYRVISSNHEERQIVISSIFALWCFCLVFFEKDFLEKPFYDSSYYSLKFIGLFIGYTILEILSIVLSFKIFRKRQSTSRFIYQNFQPKFLIGLLFILCFSTSAVHIARLYTSHDVNLNLIDNYKLLMAWIENKDIKEKVTDTLKDTLKEITKDDDH